MEPTLASPGVRLRHAEWTSHFLWVKRQLLDQICNSADEAEFSHSCDNSVAEQDPSVKVEGVEAQVINIQREVSTESGRTSLRTAVDQDQSRWSMLFRLFGRSGTASPVCVCVCCRVRRVQPRERKEWF